MKNQLFDVLAVLPEYKQFRKRRRIRAIAAILIIIVFGIVVALATDFNSFDEISFLYFGLIVIGMVFAIKNLYNSVFKKPIIVISGMIKEIKEKKRTVNEENQMRTRVTHLYKVSNGEQEIWCSCIYDYLNGRECKHSIGDTVMAFSISPGNAYMIKQ